jgi:hypothetical protein
MMTCVLIDVSSNAELQAYNTLDVGKDISMKKCSLSPWSL